MLNDRRALEILMQKISCMIMIIKNEQLNEILISHLPLIEGNAHAIR